MDDKANVEKEKDKQLMTAPDGNRGLCVHIQLTLCKLDGRQSKCGERERQAINDCY